MGYDTLFFNSGDDSRMVAQALSQGRIIITKDAEIMKRRLVTSGRLKAVLINGDEPEQQMLQLISALGLECQFRPFSRCLECNQALEERSREQVQGRVPPYVFRTHRQYMECPACHRIYWQGTHWEAMTEKLKRFTHHNTLPSQQG